MGGAALDGVVGCGRGEGMWCGTGPVDVVVASGKRACLGVSQAVDVAKLTVRGGVIAREYPGCMERPRCCRGVLVRLRDGSNVVGGPRGTE